MMKYAVIFIVLSFTCIFLAATCDSMLTKFIAASSATAFCGVGLGYAFLGPKVFCKQSDGRLNPLSYFLYWPYHLLNIFSLWSFRHSGQENAYDKIDENVYIGCRLNPRDTAEIAKLGIASVLDLTCEFSEVPALRALSYRCILVLDTCPLTLEQLKAGAAWINDRAGKGAVYVHCALSHGRSATFVAAYLLLSGQAHPAQEAVAQIAEQRPKIGLSTSQMALLKQVETEVRPNTTQ